MNPDANEQPGEAGGRRELLGLAALMRMVFSGADLVPVGERLMARAAADPQDAEALMDLSTILQIWLNHKLALATQAQALAMQQLYRLPAAGSGEPGIRLLALMAPGDLMTNTPLDLLLEGSDVALDMLYLAQGLPLPQSLPEHDVLFVAIGESDRNRPLLAEIEEIVGNWPRPVLNLPERIVSTSREGASALLEALPGVVMPIAARVGRPALERLARAELPIVDLLHEGAFPIIVRPIDSHAGKGLSKIDDPAGAARYLQDMPESEFYVSRFVDYRSPDGLYRKYRVALIGGRAFAVHMGVSAHWMIHYLNAGMTESAEKRAEEARFMADFDEDFARRHGAALAAVHQRFGLDYLVIDCAEDADGRLLIFEVDTGGVVHALDPVELFPYKQAQMRKVFAAFRELLAGAMKRGCV